MDQHISYFTKEASETRNWHQGSRPELLWGGPREGKVPVGDSSVGLCSLRIDQGPWCEPWRTGVSCMNNFFSRTFFLEFLPLRFFNLLSSSVSLPYARISTFMWPRTVVLDLVSELQFHVNTMPLGTWFLFKEGFFCQSRNRSQGCSPVNSQTTFWPKLTTWQHALWPAVLSFTHSYQAP